jgi:hypothetical protein
MASYNGKYAHLIKALVKAKGGTMEGTYRDVQGKDVAVVIYKVEGGNLFFKMHDKWYFSPSAAVSDLESRLGRTEWASVKATGAGKSANNIGGDWDLLGRMMFGGESLSGILRLPKVER